MGKPLICLALLQKEMNIRKPSRQLKQIKNVHNKIKDLLNSCSDENEYGALVYLMDELKKRRRV